MAVSAGMDHLVIVQAVILGHHQNVEIGIARDRADRVARGPRQAVGIGGDAVAILNLLSARHRGTELDTHPHRPLPFAQTARAPRGGAIAAARRVFVKEHDLLEIAHEVGVGIGRVRPAAIGPQQATRQQVALDPLVIAGQRAALGGGAGGGCGCAARRAGHRAFRRGRGGHVAGRERP